jgi:hypothetical protein
VSTGIPDGDFAAMCTVIGVPGSSPSPFWNVSVPGRLTSVGTVYWEKNCCAPLLVAVISRSFACAAGSSELSATTMAVGFLAAQDARSNDATAGSRNALRIISSRSHETEGRRPSKEGRLASEERRFLAPAMNETPRAAEGSLR